MHDVNVYIVGVDQEFSRDLKKLLETAGFRVALCEDGSSFQSRFVDGYPVCVLLGKMMPVLRGLELIQQVDVPSHLLPIIVISSESTVSEAVKAMKLGVFDFFEKPFDAEELVLRVREAIKTSTDGHRVRDRQNRIKEIVSRLTRRERQVFDLITQGCTNKEIAIQLGISPKTVENHRAKVMRKMEAMSLSDLIRLAQDSK